MPSAPVEQEMSLSYQPPQNTQFNIFLDNRVGKLLDLMALFEGQALHVAAFSILDSVDHAVVRLVTSRAELAKRLLVRHQMPFSETDILVVQLCGEFTLTRLCQNLLMAEVNIHYAYPLMVHPAGAPAIVLHTDDLTLAGQVLRRKMFTLLGENDLGENMTPGPGGPMFI